MNRKDFQILSRVRLREAKALPGLGLYDGAYYLAGYAEAHVAEDLLFRMNWDIVGRWSAESRYNLHRRNEADLLIRAIGDRHHGVMTWLKRYW